MKGKVNLREPVIRKKDVLILEDQYFKPGNVCIVTGAASGIGRATTLAMAANGVKVLCADVDETGGKATVKMAERLGGQAQFFGQCRPRSFRVRRNLLFAPLHRFYP